MKPTISAIISTITAQLPTTIFVTLPLMRRISAVPPQTTSATSATMGRYSISGALDSFRPAPSRMFRITVTTASRAMTPRTILSTVERREKKLDFDFIT